MDEPYSSGALAASTYPRLILASIIALSCLLIIRPVSGEPGTSGISMQGLVVILLVAGYILLIEPVGFFVLTPVFLFFLPPGGWVSAACSERGQCRPRDRDPLRCVRPGPEHPTPCRFTRRLDLAGQPVSRVFYDCTPAGYGRRSLSVC